LALFYLDDEEICASKAAIFFRGVASRFAFAVPLYVVRLQRGNRHQKFAVFHIFTVREMQNQNNISVSFIYIM
jgi:hypothetical protein